MGKAQWESHANGNWLQNWEWEWEGMETDCMGMGMQKAIPGHLYYKALNKTKLHCNDDRSQSFPKP